MREHDSYLQLVTGLMNRCLSHHSEVEKEDKVRSTNLSKIDTSLHIRDGKLDPGTYDNGRNSSVDDGWKQKLELAWLSRALEPALQLFKWASSAGHSLLDCFTSFLHVLFILFDFLRLLKGSIVYLVELICT